ncbi:MAG: site-specific DNA-methyltransferase [Deltaproteobacteria bacterium]|nr:site-specific DNA-methyltransferase [Deltaproteobacteria bacterium]
MAKKKICSLAYDGKREETLVMDCAPAARLRASKTFGKPPGGSAPNMLIHGDNLRVLKALLEMKTAGGIANPDGTPGARLVYIDPPFSTRLSFRMDGAKGLHAYHDRLFGAEFIEALRMRLILIRGLLSEDGSVYLHLDWKMSHYMKVIMDEVFGPENFLNEIVWHYGGRGAKAASNQYPRNHDIILLYRKKQHVFNRQRREKRLEKGAPGIMQDSSDRWFKTAPRGDYTDASIAALAEQGRVYKTRTGRVRIKYFLREVDNGLIEERPVGDVWDDIPDAMHLSEREKTGYPTQKPRALLERVISASSNPGDIVLDAYCGCGTTLEAAARLERRWIGIDSGALAIKTSAARLKKAIAAAPDKGAFVLYETRG